MLSDEQNRTLTQIGPGTPMGDLLRRYWQPIAPEAAFASSFVQAVRLLGEDLVLFRDQGGRLGLIERACAHRLTDLAYGIPEEYGLRCPLHGWLYGEDGRCLAQPWEPEPYSHEVQLVAYPVQVGAGLIWAYLGPDEPPALPNWEPFTWEDGLVQIVLTVLDCNWLQCQENAMDLFGAEWMRRNSTMERGAGDVDVRFDIRVQHDEIEYGFHNQAEGGAPEGERPAWSVGQTALWPNGVFSGDRRSCHFEWRVPLEDERTLDVAWFFDRVAPGTGLPEQRYHHWQGRLREDDSDEKSAYLTSHSLNRMFKLWLTTKKTIDRTKETLVEADRGIVLLRNRYFSQLEVIADGGAPKGRLRYDEANRPIALPITPEPAPASPGGGPTSFEFPYIAGQPPEVETVYRQVRASWGTSEEPGAES